MEALVQERSWFDHFYPFDWIALLGFEQAWTPILNLTAPLCKLLRSVIKLFKLGRLDYIYKIYKMGCSWKSMRRHWWMRNAGGVFMR